MASDFAVAFGATIGGLVGIFLIWFIIQCCRNCIVVSQNERVIIESFGKYKKTLMPGLHVLMPIRDRARYIVWRTTDSTVNNLHQERVNIHQAWKKRIDLRESIFNFPLQTIITRDNVKLQVDAMVLYQLIDPVRVTYEVVDLSYAVSNLVHTTLRSVIGGMGLDDTLASREEINNLIQQKVSHVCLNWGLQLNRVEILEIIPTNTVQRAMDSQISAERVRRATIITADGARESQKTKAEGETQKMIALSKGYQQVRILQAKGEADSKILIAEAEAQSLRIISEALSDFGYDSTQYMIAIKYIETLTRLATSSSRTIFYLPLDVNLVGALREILDTKK
ncbi:stomatin-like protein 2 [Anaeramoeba ignava]|uniref:Stomatin-like protein 2 n=1 Tax=Anaeramoeba ignava TaxID=1746090 RepID=A0A9Q0RCQ6_ANAIG|nr:stomatin-like protein 2 [Anaeramoeba ignava]|eukprot:Anaeramoba_ignava/a352250_90.p1 GENE.a352250_90~~a352250_90.p1  ORF type:complete len:338 (-),score=72.23 a352250_90:144-1157(-)